MNEEVDEFLLNDLHNNGDKINEEDDLGAISTDKSIDDRMGHLSREVRTLLFVHVFISNLIINIDHGVMPAAVPVLKRDLGLSNASLGLLGSLVYLGLTFGSIASSPLFNLINAKYVIGSSLLLNAVAMLVFPMVDIYYVQAFSRFVVGFLQVFTCIYFPVWIDIFGPNDRKTIWLTLIQLAVPLGIVVGYILTALLVMQLSWKYAFYLQVVLLTPSGIMFFLYPSKYFVYDFSEEEELITEMDEKDYQSENDGVKSYQTFNKLSGTDYQYLESIPEGGTGS